MKLSRLSQFLLLLAGITICKDSKVHQEHEDVLPRKNAELINGDDDGFQDDDSYYDDDSYNFEDYNDYDDDDENRFKRELFSQVKLISSKLIFSKKEEEIINTIYNIFSLTQNVIQGGSINFEALMAIASKLNNKRDDIIQIAVEIFSQLTVFVQQLREKLANDDDMYHDFKKFIEEKISASNSVSVFLLLSEEFANNWKSNPNRITQLKETVRTLKEIVKDIINGVDGFSEAVNDLIKLLKINREPLSFSGRSLEECRKGYNAIITEIVNVVSRILEAMEKNQIPTEPAINLLQEQNLNLFPENLLLIFQLASEVYCEEKLLRHGNNNNLEGWNKYMHIIAFLSAQRDINAAEAFIDYIEKNPKEIPDTFLCLGVNSLRNIVQTLSFQKNSQRIIKILSGNSPLLNKMLPFLHENNLKNKTELVEVINNHVKNLSDNSFSIKNMRIIYGDTDTTEEKSILHSVLMSLVDEFAMRKHENDYGFDWTPCLFEINTEPSETPVQYIDLYQYMSLKSIFSSITKGIGYLSQFLAVFFVKLQEDQYQQEIFLSILTGDIEKSLGIFQRVLFQTIEEVSLLAEEKYELKREIKKLIMALSVAINNEMKIITDVGEKNQRDAKALLMSYWITNRMKNNIYALDLYTYLYNSFRWGLLELEIAEASQQNAEKEEKTPVSSESA